MAGPKPGYAAICLPRRALADHSLSRTELACLLFVGEMIYRYGDCFASHSTIAARVGVVRETVSRSMKGLERRGYLEIVGRRRRANQYRLIGDEFVTDRNVPDVTMLSQDEPLSVTGPSQETVMPEVTLDTDIDLLPPFSPPDSGGTERADLTAAPIPRPLPPDMGVGEPRAPRDRSDEAATWRRLKAAMKAQLEPATFRSWIAPLSIKAIDGGAVELIAPSRFIADRVRADHGIRLRDNLTEIVPGFTGRIAFVVPPGPAKPKEF